MHFILRCPQNPLYPLDSSFSPYYQDVSGLQKLKCTYRPKAAFSRRKSMGRRHKIFSVAFPRFSGAGAVFRVRFILGQSFLVRCRSPTLPRPGPKDFLVPPGPDRGSGAAGPDPLEKPALSGGRIRTGLGAKLTPGASAAGVCYGDGTEAQRPPTRSDPIASDGSVRSAPGWAPAPWTARQTTLPLEIGRHEWESRLGHRVVSQQEKSLSRKELRNRQNWRLLAQDHRVVCAIPNESRT